MTCSYCSICPTLFPSGVRANSDHTQSIQFLVAAREYKESLRAPGEIDTVKSFAKLSEIVEKFVRDRSPFEVNVK